MASKAPLVTHHHVVPIRVYALVLCGLVVLMLSTVLIAEVNLPGIGPISGTAVNQVVALAIACAKALLVILYFMGARWATTLTRLFVMMGFTWLTFFGMIFTDYATRKYEPIQGWDSTGESGLQRAPLNPGAPEKPLAPNDQNIRPRG